MSRTYPLYQVDAFTTRPFSGNPAGVIIDDGRLSDGEMQAIARELNNPESAFVVMAADGRSCRVRYFTPTVEVPICGHATIATHYVLARLGLRPFGDWVQQSASGDTTVAVLDQPVGDISVRMRQGRARFEPPLSTRIAQDVAAALRLDRAALASVPMQVVGTGHAKVIVGVRTRQALFGLAPDMTALTRLSQVLGCNGYFCYTLDVDDPGLLTECRMFAPAIGIPEDPVTGNGQGPLGAYLVAHGLAVPVDGRLSFWSSQGVTMGRPGRARVTVEFDAAGEMHVEVGERAVIAFRTELSL